MPYFKGFARFAQLFSLDRADGLDEEPYSTRFKPGRAKRLKEPV